MDILNELVFKNKNFEVLSIVLKNHYLNKEEFRPIISYDEFKRLVRFFNF